MSTHRIRTLVPAPVTAPRGADALATAAAMLSTVSARALARRRVPAALIVSKSHA
jgi:thiamine biosynthesis lipoprotein ApbE